MNPYTILCLGYAVLLEVLRAQELQPALLAEWGCFAIRNLACDSEMNKTALGAAGACEGKWEG